MWFETMVHGRWVQLTPASLDLYNLPESMPIFATRNAAPSVPPSPIASLIQSALTPVGMPLLSSVHIAPASMLL